jgi:hypothetical protein
MPHSDDPPSVAPSASVASEAPSASRPNASAENVAEDANPPNAPPHDSEPRRPRRRRHRRRPASASGPGEAGAFSAGQVTETVVAGKSPAADASQSARPADSEPHKPRRRRRRHRGPPRDAVSEEVSAGGAEGEAGEGIPGDPEAQSASTGDSAQGRRTLSLPRRDNVSREQPRRRRRHRRAPRDPGSTELQPGAKPQSGSEAAAPRNGPATIRKPRIGGPRSRPREAELREGETRDAASRERRAHDTGQGDIGPRQPGRRDQEPRGRGRRDKGSKDRRQGRGREPPQKRPEPKLYALESVVDRGFEDVADQSDESLTRRVHWTIIKRTVADQKSGKAMSAVYVLQRDGVDSEFPNLGAARAAVNKTIVHPEKLTLSKAEHAAAKK